MSNLLQGGIHVQDTSQLVSKLIPDGCEHSDDFELHTAAAEQIYSLILTRLPPQKVLASDFNVIAVRFNPFFNRFLNPADSNSHQTSLCCHGS